MTRPIKDIIADAAAELESVKPELAEELRAIKLPGRKENPLLLEHQINVRAWMIQKLENERWSSEAVLAEVVRRHGGTKEKWWRIRTGEGRPKLRKAWKERYG